jgi:hypothetical protein
MQIMQPGHVNEFWECILRIRDSGDKRWTHTFSEGFKLSAAYYELNRNALKKAA